jgi:hypothetical protein
LFFFGFWSVIVSLAELAKAPGMPSEVSIRKLIADHPDFPIVARGRNGVAYQFDVDDVCAWWLDRRQREEVDARAHQAEINQHVLELLGGDAVSAPEPGLSTADRKGLIEEEIAAIKLAEKRGDLVRKQSVEEAVSSAIIAIKDRLSTFSARLSRRHDIERELFVAIDTQMSGDLAAIADALDQMGSQYADGASKADPGI